jgi:hypothetical protein
MTSDEERAEIGRLGERVAYLEGAIADLPAAGDTALDRVAGACDLIDTLTRERDEARAERDSAFGRGVRTVVDPIRAIVGGKGGDLVADVRRIVERLDGREHDVGDERGAQIATLRTYLARALRGCDPAERTAIEADMAREVSCG